MEMNQRVKELSQSSKFFMKAIFVHETGNQPFGIALDIMYHNNTSPYHFILLTGMQ